MKIYPDLASAQEALDRGETIQIAIEPFALDPALLQESLDLQSQEKVTCDLCGSKYLPDDGYFEPGEYSYCSECCHW